MDSKLVKVTGKFIDYILNSWHYLNDPKCEFNYRLDCMYRQGIVEGKQKISNDDLLKLYNEGKSVKDIALMYNMSKSTLFPRIKKLTKNLDIKK